MDGLQTFRRVPPTGSAQWSASDLESNCRRSRGVTGSGATLRFASWIRNAVSHCESRDVTDVTANSPTQSLARKPASRVGVTGTLAPVNAGCEVRGLMSASVVTFSTSRLNRRNLSLGLRSSFRPYHRRTRLIRPGAERAAAAHSGPVVLGRDLRRAVHLDSGDHVGGEQEVDALA